MALAHLTCVNHPGRHGSGFCGSCKKTICDECATRVEGVLTCQACLGKEVAHPRGRHWRSLSALLPALLAAPVAYGAITLGLYGLVLVIALVARTLARG